MKGMRIQLIRHGETRLQKERCYQGITDEPLSEEGLRKLHRAGVGVDRVYVSSLKRARQSAAILFPDISPVSLMIVEGLREMDFGSFEGRSAAQMEEDPDYREWVEGMCRGRCPGGEDLGEYTNRVCKAFSWIMEDAIKHHFQEIAIVAHGGTQMVLLEVYGPSEKDYWQWQLPCGQGYLLEASGWGEKDPENLTAEKQKEKKCLRILERLSYCG